MEFTTGKKLILGSLLVFVFGGLYAVYLYHEQTRQAENDQAKMIFTSNPDTPTYTDINGNPVALEDYLGTTVVATTWASWSPFSASDLTALDTIAKDYREAGVTFLAINRKETRERAQRYIATIPELLNVVLVIDSEDKFYSLVGGYAMPETVVFNRTGEIIAHVRGELKPEEIRAVLDTNN